MLAMAQRALVQVAGSHQSTCEGAQCVARAGAHVFVLCREAPAGRSPKQEAPQRTYVHMIYAVHVQGASNLGIWRAYGGRSKVRRMGGRGSAVMSC